MKKVARDLLRDALLLTADLPEGLSQTTLHNVAHIKFREGMGYGISCPVVNKHIDQLIGDGQLEVIEEEDWIIRTKR